MSATTDRPPDTAIPTMREFAEHKGWRNNNPMPGVTWDGTCSKCGFALTNKPFVPGKVAIEGDGRRIARVVSYLRIGGETFRSTSHVLACSVCVPDIMRARED